MMKYQNQQIHQNNDHLSVNSNLSNKLSKQTQFKQNLEQQEDEDQASLYLSKQYDHSKPTFLRTFPQQPVDCQGSEDLMAPTILSNILSAEQIVFKSDHKKHQQLNHGYETSNISSSQNSMRSILECRKYKQINQEKVKMIINQIKVKLLNLIHYSKYNDPILTKEYQELSPFKYHYFTMYIFLSTTISNLLASILIPLVQFFEISILFQVLSQIIFGFNLITIFQDLFFQRGPYKMCRGIIKVNHSDESKKLLDTIRMLLLIFNNFFQIEPNVKLLTILLMMLLSLWRQNESFENIYRSTHHFIFICQLWVTVIVSFVCTYQVFYLDEDLPLSYSIVLAISFLTHCSNISIEISNQNSVLISIYMILSYLCLAYTSMIFYIWLKPEIEIQEEKQKLLKGFVERFRQKCENDDLLRRCYSYLEFRIDEDLNKAKDQLTKKLSPDLEDEIELSLRSIMIEKIELMNRFSPHFKQQLLYEIEQVQFNPEDNIIIEHQADDLGLFYILKGQVKVQFQGSSFGTNKREVATLSEGQTFGQYSFITGNPSNISIFSSGSTILMKLKRSDFTSIISNYPTDNEIFCTMKDNAFYNQKMFECYYCKISGHYIVECKHIQYFPQRLNTIEKYLYTEKQQRRTWNRRLRKCFAWQDLSLNQDKAKQYANKQSQEQISDELPEISQLPYSENQTYQSVSFVSNSMGQKNLSPEQYQSYSNVESCEQFNIDQDIQDEQTIPFQEHQVKTSIRKNSNKTTLKTAGFAIEPNMMNNLSMVDKDDKEIINQLEHQMNKEKTILYQTARNYNTNKLTFQYQKEQSQSILREDLIKSDSFQQQQQSLAIYQQQQASNLKQSIRQTSNRSNTYSNSLSKDISNNPSSNSRQNRSQRQSMQSSQDRVMEQTGTRKLNSSKSLTNEQNRMNNNKSLKSCTKSTPNQMSQFQALTSPENQGYYLNDVLFNKFEKMCEYKIYNPHNNYSQVINRYKKYIESQSYNNFCRKKHISSSSYSIRCFVVSRIRRVKKLV
ncbi:unnamed protein product [Paramecium octaurelia]|uniref:Cyclic nucleotide-binding domain-containing protein n=1 Tax=Paramecium octaurelia TaxID=43137 RepID=A0A8S1VA13_PAROT|nr:unnamed protein product [Paramecium octaurelia]